MGLSRSTTAARDCWIVAIAVDIRKLLLLKGSSSPDRTGNPVGQSDWFFPANIPCRTPIGAQADCYCQGRICVRKANASVPKIIRLRVGVVRPHDLQPGPQA